MAFYGGMMATYSPDVQAKEEKECKEGAKKDKTEACGTVSSGGGGSGTANVGGDGGAPGSTGDGGGGSPSGPTSPEGGGSSGKGSTGSGTEGGKTQDTAASTSPKPESTPTEATVTVTTTSVTCEGTTRTKASDAKSSEVSYVGCSASSENASCMAVTGAIASSTSGANGGSPKMLAACMGAASTTESGTSDGTICGGIALHGSNDSKSDDATAAIAACATADAEVSSKSKDGGKSRLIIQECVGVSMRKTKEKRFFLAVGIRSRIAFSKTKSSNSKK
ncbi:hypothetical protein BgAZ_402760 [Babesia gibsoni]|uniref:Uncharacterized protein n=1 Tax=Babesia gibsoni TaxID=33632 RepID=A0AAD8PDJ8_BABGI|nr:hypothetical protein BgAZ_402760 [Babesia gibsoni]